MSTFHFDYGEPPKDLHATRGDFQRIARYLLPAWRLSVLILGCILETFHQHGLTQWLVTQ